MTAKGFGTCIFKERRGKGCEFWMAPNRFGVQGECGAEDWDIIRCYLDHYGNPLKADGGIRILDAIVHLVLANDEGFDTPGPYDLPRDMRVRIKGERP